MQVGRRLPLATVCYAPRTRTHRISAFNCGFQPVDLLVKNVNMQRYMLLIDDKSPVGNIGVLARLVGHIMRRNEGLSPA
jgi:hypothetical protein